MIDETLKNAIRESGLSLNAIAVATGIQASMLSRFINGERDIRLATAARIAEYLGLSLSKDRRRSPGRK